MSEDMKSINLTRKSASLELMLHVCIILFVPDINLSSSVNIHRGKGKNLQKSMTKAACFYFSFKVALH